MRQSWGISSAVIRSADVAIVQAWLGLGSCAPAERNDYRDTPNTLCTLRHGYFPFHLTGSLPAVD